MFQKFSTFNSLTYSEAVDLCLSLADFERNTHSPNHSDFHLERMMFLADFIILEVEFLSEIKREFFSLFLFVWMCF